MAENPSLKGHLVSTLSTLPNSSALRIYAFTSKPRRTRELFPHSSKHPRCFQTDYLVLLAADVEDPAPTVLPVSTLPKTGEQLNSKGESSLASQAPPTTSSVPHQPDGTNEKKPLKPVFTSALYAHLYTFPQSSSSILYISKVDSSSYGHRLPLTRNLLKGFIGYHLLPTTRSTPTVRVQLFARSQGQYLFPNSAGNKKSLGGLKLCGWWKGVYEDIVRDVVARSNLTSQNGVGPPQGNGDGEGEKPGEGDVEYDGSRRTGEQLGNLSMSYILPSYSEAEALGFLGHPKPPLPEGYSWKYSPPFQTPITTSSSSDQASYQPTSLANLIPSLPDDPKTRFLDELVDSESFIRTDVKATTGSAGGSSSSQTQPPKGKEDEYSQSREKTPVSVSVSAESNTINPSPTKKRKRSAKDIEEEELERKHSESVLSKLGKEEFWERMAFRQEMAIDITGFFTLEVTPSFTTSSSLSVTMEEGTKMESKVPDPTAREGQINPVILERLERALVNTDFGTLSSAIDATESWLASSKTIVVDEVGEQGWELGVGFIAAKEGVSKDTAGLAEKRKEEPVTVLQVRKKKRT